MNGKNSNIKDTLKNGVMIMNAMVLLVFIAFAKANSQQISSTTTNTVLLYDHPASKAVEVFFQDFHKQDTVALKQSFVAGAGLQSLSVTQTEQKMTAITAATFLKNIAAIPANVVFEERLTSVQTLGNETVASVHTDYEFYLNNMLSHKGRNVFTLVFIDDQWKITQITDTRFY